MYNLKHKLLNIKKISSKHIDHGLLEFDVKISAYFKEYVRKKNKFQKN